MFTGGELWIAGNDDAGGIGALGVAAGLIAEEAQFTVHSCWILDEYSKNESSIKRERFSIIPRRVQ